MASQPEKLPDSIILGQFKGIRNTLARERLMPDELESAINVDIDDQGQARRRRGYSLKLAGNCHSLRDIGGRVLVVKDGVLGVLGTDFTFTSLGAQVGPEQLDYTQVDETTYFSSQTASGYLTGDTVSPWGAVADDGEWVSPVVTPTDTLGEVFGVQITAPPMATDIAAYSGRIYFLAGKYIWATELWMPNYMQRTRNFLQLGAEGTMLRAVNDGLYVGTERGLFFYKGTLSEGFRVDKVSDAPVVRRSAVTVPASSIGDAPVAEGLAIMFMTDDGIFAAFDGGRTMNLTLGRVAFPKAQSAAALCRDDSGVTSYVAVADSAGGPAANARIGDFVDAEIIRAADRG